MSKRAISIFFLLTMIVFPAIAKGSYNSFQYPSLPSFIEANSNGAFEIYIEKEGEWKNAGRLSFDKYLRQKEIELENYTNNNVIKIKLKKTGGNMAHIDSVFLNNVPPSKINTHDKLNKLTENDFDVIDASNKEVELEFSVREKGKAKLALTARIEGNRISKTPFQYPLKNLYKTVGKDSEFYNYKPGNGKEVKEELIFMEYSVAGSGHPSGYTYGWISNDNENIYVTLDFTPDNTMDGDADYAKLYIKTDKGLKEFKITSTDEKWGRAFFTYTDKVSYEHKVYKFKIPFRETGLNHAKQETIQLAFAAYGTAAPPGGDFDSTTRRYLLVYGKDSDIYGQFVSENGTAIGSEFVICNAFEFQYNASVTYNSNNEQFLVVWTDYRNSGQADIYGRIVNANGSFSGTEFIICDNSAPQYAPKLAYNSTTNQYLVVWVDYRDFDKPQIYGQIVNSNGTLSGTNFLICFYISSDPSVVYNNNTNQYLIVWEDYRSGSKPDIYGQIVNANGSLSGSNFVICYNSEYQIAPSVAYNSDTNKYLVVWMDERSGSNWDIYGRVVNANGSLSGSDYAICNDSSGQGWPSVAYNSNIDKFLVAWEDDRTGPVRIYGKFLNSDGTPDGGDLIIYSTRSMDPYVIPNNFCPNYLVGLADISELKYSWTVYGSPCQYSLSVHKEGTGTGSINASGCAISWVGNSGKCTANGGTLITLSATGNAGSFFSGWSGGTGSAAGCSGTGNCIFTLNGNSEVTGTFSLKSYSLSVSKIGAGNGTITSVPSGIECGSDCDETYLYGTDVTLTANPDRSSVFAGWSGDCSSCGLNKSCTINIDNDKACIANFDVSSCTYNINPASAIVGYKGKKVSVKVSATGEECSAPTISSENSWITGIVKSFKKNRGNVLLTISQNEASTLRTGTVIIGGQTFTVTQKGAPCKIKSINPLKASFTNTGGTGTIQVSAPEGCSWLAATDSKTAWVTIDSGISGTGNGTVGYTVESNTSAGAKNRSGKIIITSIENSKKTHTIIQTK